MRMAVGIQLAHGGRHTIPVLRCFVFSVTLLIDYFAMTAEPASKTTRCFPSRISADIAFTVSVP